MNALSHFADESDAVDALLGREAVTFTRLEDGSETQENTRTPDGTGMGRRDHVGKDLAPCCRSSR